MVLYDARGVGHILILNLAMCIKRTVHTVYGAGDAATEENASIFCLISVW